MTAPIAIIMGSQSDWETMRHAAETLTALGIDCEKRIVSAHRTPDRLFAFARGAKAQASRSSSPAPAARPISRAWRRR
jgi:5-(carboxyamino)imidazole ribonucleotide mutase